MKRLEDLVEGIDRPDPLPWTQIGVFPIAEFAPADDEDWATGATGFNYTIDLGPEDLWIPASSIEGRYMGNQVAASFLNVITFAYTLGLIVPGEDILSAIGMPDGADADAVFWLGELEDNDGSRETLQSHAEFILPILWSSPLGWPS